jgi:hypothetical protein
MTDPIRLTLPLPPNVANQRVHWRAKLKQKNSYWNVCSTLRHARKVPRPPADWPPLKARIAVRLFVWNTMDPDNAMARLKWVLDWLQAWDYIADDSPSALEWAGMPEQQIDRKDQRIEIELTAAHSPDGGEG